MLADARQRSRRTQTVAPSTTAIFWSRPRALTNKGFDMSNAGIGTAVTHYADVVVVTVRGELDPFTAPVLGQVLD